MKTVYEIDPLRDVRWRQFLARHRMATLFHSPEWLAALQRTYGYSAGVLTTAAPGAPLGNGLVFCRVQSRLTGKRLVSVPFSDHCTPLFDTAEELGRLVSRFMQEADRGKDKYLEIRSIAGIDAAPAGLTGTGSFCLHRLDLRPGLSELFHALHRDCIRRKIARSQREDVTYEEGTSDELLLKFYKLAILTRRRQHLVPQPLSWFRNLIACMGEGLKLRVVSQQGQPAAAILTIRYKSVMTYKYGCSDPRFHRLGCMQLPMWKAIEDGKENGLLELDLGRTDWSNEGLLTYKDRWGAARSTLLYFRHAAPGAREISIHIPRRFLASAPDRFLSMAGKLLYRHLG